MPEYFFSPDVNDRDLWNYNLGGSATTRSTRDFNLMLEAVAVWEEDIADPAESLAAPPTTNDLRTKNRSHRDSAFFSRCALRVQSAERLANRSRRGDAHRSHLRFT